MNNKPEVISTTSVLDKTGFEWESNDCVVRALAIATDTDYATAHQWTKQHLKRPDRKGTFATAIRLEEIIKRGIDLNNKHLIIILLLFYYILFIKIFL